MTPFSSRALVASSILAAALLFGSMHVPLWGMKLEAPQYPKGLHLRAYGDRIEGDLREINIINHYVGMKAIDAVPAPEMALFPYSIYGLMGLCLLAPLHRRLYQLAVIAIFGVAAVILVDLQWWLRSFGQDLNPAAPIRVEPFTPLAVGTSTIGNFHSTAMVSWGYVAIVGAAVVLFVGRRRGRAAHAASNAPSTSLGAASAAAVLAAASLFGSGSVSEAQTGLQERIERATSGDVVVVDGGTHAGPLDVRGPLTLEGRNGAVVDGGGTGSVIVVRGSGVVIRGLTIRGSGRNVSEEAAGIKASGGGHLFEHNVIEDVYFGVHLSDGSDNVVRENRIAPGVFRGARPATRSRSGISAAA